MRIDLICGSYPPDVCGVADYTRHLARKLRECGADAEILTTAGRDSGCDPDVPASALAPDWTVRGARQLARLLRERGPDVVHIQFPAKPYHGHWGIHILPLLLKSAAPRVVTTLHEYCMAPWGGRFKQLLNVWLSDSVIVTTEQDRALVTRWTRAKHVRVIPIGSNIEPLGTAGEGRAILESLGVPGGAPVLVYFGFVRPGKGVEAALQALSEAPDGAALAIVSPDPSPDYRQALATVCSTLGIESRVYWTGYRGEREVSSILRAASLAILPFEDGATFRRGTLLAALAHGLPVVTTRSSATPATLTHGVNALMADAGDPGSLGRLVSDLLSSPDLPRGLSDGARALGEQFSWDSIASSTLDAYTALARRSVPCA